MGVRGLATYIDKNRDVLRDIEFRASPLVIDGNNLYYALHHTLKAGHVTNGDYDLFAKRIQKFFRHLWECDVTPYVILDGAYEPDDRKMKTVMSRLKEKLHQASLGSKGLVECKMMPILGYETFVSTLRHMGIKHCMADFEADEAMVTIANQLEAPILSNDSDFFIYNCKHGFFRLDYFDHSHVRRNEKGDNFFNVKKYDIPTFCSHHPGLRDELIPLFATLIGNDFVEGFHFENFFAQIPKPKYKRGKSGVKGNHRHCKMEGLLEWMQKLETVQQGLDLVLPHMKKEKHENLKEWIAKGLNGYNEHPGHFLAFFKDSTVIDCQLRSKNCQQPLPTPLWLPLRSAEFSQQVLNMFVNQRSFIGYQIEDMDEDPAALLSQPIRDRLYSLLASISSLQDEPYLIRELTRNGRRISQLCLEVDVKDNLLELLAKEKNEKVAYLLQVCEMTSPEVLQFIGATPDYFKLYFLSVIYTFRRSEHLRFLELLAFLVSQTYCSSMMFHSYSSYRDVFCAKTTTDETPSAFDFHSSVESCSASDLSAIKDRFSSYVASKFRDKLRLRLLHGTAQWQATFQVLSFLNRLLQNPLPNPDPALLYNGTLISTLHTDLKTRAKPKVFVMEELFQKTKLGSYAVDMFEKMTTLLGLESETAGPRTKKKVKKAKKTKMPESDVEDEISDNEPTEPWSDANNRFANLLAIES